MSARFVFHFRSISLLNVHIRQRHPFFLRTQIIISDMKSVLESAVIFYFLFYSDLTKQTNAIDTVAPIDPWKVWQMTKTRASTNPTIYNINIVTTI